MKVLLASSEVVPFSKTGGLADVAGALPIALKNTGGCEARAIAPLYRMTKDKKLPLRKIKHADGLVQFGRQDSFDLFECELDGIIFYFIGKDEYYDREALYGTAKGDYEDNADRFSFFCRAALAVMIDRQFYPDVIHVHDWQSALVPLYKNLYVSQDHPLSRSKVLFTVHNLAYQGLFEPGVLEKIGIPNSFFNMDSLEFYGKVNFMKAGILYSDAVSTVSRKYSQEILTKEFGCGLEGLLESRKQDLFGILNGVDYSQWDPKTDTLLPATYDLNTLEKKEICKKALLDEYGMKLAASKPLVGYVGRLAEQKGIDLMTAIIPRLARAGAGFVLLGKGDEKYEKLLKNLPKRYKQSIGIRIDFDNKLAHMIEAGCDIFAMPSRYEPCGLNQMYSLKYGAIPVVRSTGGLDDTIIDYSEDPASGNGFKFRDATPDDFFGALERCMSVYKNKDEWQRLQKKGMEADFSWTSSAAQYVSLFKRLLQKTKNSKRI